MQLQRDNLKQVIELSIVPNVECKILAKNCAKNFTSELRRLPAFELVIALTEAYPSNQPPEILVKSEFYRKYETEIVEKLKELWSEGCPVIFSCVNFIWDEMIDSLQMVNKGTISLEYK